jgi:hypothetical protein
MLDAGLFWKKNAAYAELPAGSLGSLLAGLL